MRSSSSPSSGRDGEAASGQREHVGVVHDALDEHAEGGRRCTPPIEMRVFCMPRRARPGVAGDLRGGEGRPFQLMVEMAATASSG